MPAKKRQKTATKRKPATRICKTRKDDGSDCELDDSSSFSSSSEKGLKRRKVSAKQNNHQHLLMRPFGTGDSHHHVPPETSAISHSCLPPLRRHSIMYHRPLLLEGHLGRDGRRSLLAWFDSVSESRSMPWRKAWVDPSQISDPTRLRQVLQRRAYEVWISEIMLQQTRVAVVIDYWNRWMSKWPSIHDLAAARSEDVLAAWSGLGYYSRATRIHEAAKLAVKDPGMRGLLPSSAKELEAKMPGVGRYTAGAISCIVFGRAEPMVDGNVLRVLSRQLGIHGNIKTDKAVIDAIWAAADSIVKATAAFDGDGDGDVQTLEDGSSAPKSNIVSNRPGRWGQGLMELGSTVCTPKPNCSLCPITSTCRAYREGEAISSSRSNRSVAVADMEDACTLCEPFENSMDESDQDSFPKEDANTSKAHPKSAKQASLTAFAFTTTRTTRGGASSETEAATKTNDNIRMEPIINHARKFPIKAVKKAVRVEETLVCAIRRKSDGHYLIHRRPLKGLLAGLWELPSQLVETATKGSAPPSEKTAKAAQSYVASLLDCEGKALVDHIGALGSVPWLFSHIKLTMHVHLFTLDDTDASIDFKVLGKRMERPSRWVIDMGAESMGTGMRKCWALVEEYSGD